MHNHDHRSRVKSLQRMQAAHGIHCVALMPGANLLYFTGLPAHISERPTVAFVPAEGRLAVLIPELEAPAARKHLPEEARLYTYRDEEGHEALFREVAADLGLDGRAIGVEYLAMRVLELRRIEQAAPNSRLLAVEPWLPPLRMSKDRTELDHMRHAVDIAERAMQSLIDAKAIRAGRSEMEVAADLRVALMQEGALGEAFLPIVVAGPNSAFPHATPSDRRMDEGELVIIDWGAVYKGYRSDITRTFVLGTPTPEMERMHDAVLAANQAGRAAVRPGLPAQEVDRAARQVITRADYGAYFIHRTGHGLGLETHEPPYIVEGNLEHLMSGVTFTVEPGIYVSELGGVRIEDDVVVTADAVETLTSMSRELVRL